MQTITITVILSGKAEKQMEKIEIKKITLSDLENLQAISRQTFVETFAAVNTESNMKKYLDENFSREKLTAEMLNPDSEFYFAVIQDKILGYLKVNSGPAQTELKDPSALEIERIYVLKAFHGRKIGQQLYEKAIQIADRLQAGYVWLGVWENNSRALNFYRKNGFTEFGQHHFKLGDDVQNDLMMKFNCNKKYNNSKL